MYEKGRPTACRHRAPLASWLLGLLAVIVPGVHAAGSDAPLAALREGVAAARAEAVDVLAPDAFADAERALAAAEKALASGRDASRVQRALDDARKALAAAGRIAGDTRVTLAGPITARTAALTAEAPRLAPQSWSRASDRFDEAVARVERGDADGARRRGVAAEELLRAAELEAIGASVLGTARDLIAQAGERDVADAAPRTLGDAERLALQAEQEIARNRYDLMLPRDLAAQAEYQARHALLLADVITRALEADGDQHALEALILDWEAPLAKLAAALGITPRFDEGLLRSIDDITRRAGELAGEAAASARAAASLRSELERRGIALPPALVAPSGAAGGPLHGAASPATGAASDPGSGAAGADGAGTRAMH
jgi:hypothetical protein